MHMHPHTHTRTHRQQMVDSTARPSPHDRTLARAGVLAIAGSTMFIFLWENYKVWPYARGGTARTPLELVVSPPAAATAAAAPAADAAAPVPAVSAADAPDGAGGKL